MQVAHEVRRFQGTTSHLGTLLQLLCVWGEVSWSVGQQIANAAKMDATEFALGIHPMVDMFAKLGTFGIYVGNVRRDAMRAFKPVVGLSPPLLVRLPFKHTKSVDSVLITEMDFPILMPSVLFEDLFQHFTRKFLSMLGAGVERFWNSLRNDDPRLIGNPMLDVPNWRKIFAPLVLHGGGVSFTQKIIRECATQCDFYWQAIGIRLRFFYYRYSQKPTGYIRLRAYRRARTTRFGFTRRIHS